MTTYTAADRKGIEVWLIPLVDPMSDLVLFRYRSELRERLYSLSRPERILLDVIEMEIEMRVRRSESMKYGLGRG
jgi:hypothetical protein